MIQSLPKSVLISLTLSISTPAFSQSTQKVWIQTYMGLRGNTGFKGGFLFDNSKAQIGGNDFYIIQFKAVKNCTVVVEVMEVIKAEKIIQLKPAFLDSQSEMKVIAGETISVRAEKDKFATEIPLDKSEALLPYEGKLKIKVNGIPTTLTVKIFENLFTH